MTSISNLFSIFDFNNDNNEKNDNKKKENVNSIKPKFASTNNANTQALQQGLKFNTYQNRIKKHLEKDIDNVNSKEGFTTNQNSSSSSSTSLTKETKKVLSSTNISSQQQSMNVLQNEYEQTVNEYEQLMQKFSGSANSYLSRVNPNNQYLGKNIQIGKNILYVTNQGVAKLYPNANILNQTAGKNNCPASAKVQKINIPWSKSYGIPGTSIPTNPPLISGTPMTSGQACGNEGTNVFVNQMINDPSSNYVGCYADNISKPLMKFIGGSPQPPSANLQNGDFSQPAIANDTYQYINSNSTVVGWEFNAVLINNSSAWGYPMPYPSGNQAACIQGLQTFGQWVTLNEGSCNLSFYACGRPGYSGANTINVCCGQTGTPQTMPTVYSFTPSTTAWQQYSTTISTTSSGSYFIGFYGTINNQDNSTAIQNIQLSGSGVGGGGGTYNYSQCQQAAIDNGYQYFALQDVNPNTAQGYCAVSNDLPTSSSLGQGFTPSGQTVVWSSNTSGQTGNTATLTTTGSLSVLNSGGQSVFNTPNSTAQPSNYLGCYGDSPNRAMTAYNNGAQQYNLEQCQQIAQQNGSTWFGLQNSTSGTNAQCFLSGNWEMTTEYGPAGNCTQLSDGTYSGGGYSNAVYNTTTPSSNYVLIIGDSYIQLQRGTSPNDNQGQIWGMNFTQGEPNPNYVAANGKYGQNWVTQGSTLAAGDFIGSPNGYAALIMQGDGNLVLYTFQNVLNCQKMSDGNTGGGQGANALYNIGDVGNTSDMGKLAYIDQNAELHAYPSSNAKYTNSYTIFTGMDSTGNDIDNASYSNTTVERCQTTCDAMNNCAGFTFSNNTCYPKNSGMYPNGARQLNNESSLYIKNQVPKTTPIGVPSTTNSIDTVAYQNYVNGGGLSNSYGLASNISSTQKQQLSQLQDKINLLSNQMSNLNGKLNTDNYSVTQQTLKNMKGLGTYTEKLVNTKNQISGFNANNMDNIVEDSEITVLQQNYNYLFWSILATGTILVSMNIMK
jgi:hypothetical protein